MSQDWSLFQWLAPELVRGGFLKNEHWVEDSAARAAKLTETQAEAIIATLFAVTRPYAIDYLEQAPVIMIAFADAASPMTPQSRKYLIQRFTGLIDERPKVRDLLDRLKIPRPLRAVDGAAWRIRHHDLLSQFRRIPPSTLAQAIPITPLTQRRWLDFLFRFSECLMRRAFPCGHYFAWAVTEAPLIGNPMGQIIEIAAYFTNNASTFSPLWTWSAALKRSQEWHDRVAKTSVEVEFLRRHGFLWNQEISYDNYPAAQTIDDITFVALQTGERLSEDGRFMHHCVATYAGMVVNRRSRIYSVRRGERRLATLELGTSNRWGECYIVRMKGPYNRSADGMAPIALRFVRSLNRREVS